MTARSNEQPILEVHAGEADAACDQLQYREGPPIPCPDLLTEEEAVRYLRLNTIAGLKNPTQTLARYRAAGLLRGTQVSKSVFYRRVELDRFLDRLTNENPR